MLFGAYVMAPKSELNCSILPKSVLATELIASIDILNKRTLICELFVEVVGIEFVYQFGDHRCRDL
jgi:hypothetical protein